MVVAFVRFVIAAEIDADEPSAIASRDDLANLGTQLAHSYSMKLRIFRFVENKGGLSAVSHPLSLDLGDQSGGTVIENVSALSRVALGCVGQMPWG